MMSSSPQFLLDVLFNWAWRASLAASVLALLVLFLEQLLRRRLSAKWLYALWLCVLVRLLMPAAPAARFSIFNWPLALAAKGPVTTPPVVAAPAATVVPETKEGARSLPAIEISIAQPSKPIWPNLLSWVWLAGAGAYLLVVLAHHRKFSLRLKRQQPLAIPRLTALIEETKLLLGVRGEVPVFESDSTPSLYGAFKPRLLLPKSVLGFDDGELRHVIWHELIHLKRRDVLLNWVLIFVQAIHWFNPVIWLALRRLRAARELACDAAILSRLPAAERNAYGATLIKIVDCCGRVSPVPSLIPILNPKEQLERRIRMIANYKPSTGLAACASAVLLIVLGCLTFTRAANKPPLDAPEVVAGLPTPIEVVAGAAAPIEIKDSRRFQDITPATSGEDKRTRLAYYQLRLELSKERALQATDMVLLRQAKEEYRNAEELHKQKVITNGAFEQARTKVEVLQAAVDEREKLLQDVGDGLKSFVFADNSTNASSGGPARARRERAATLEKMLVEQELSLAVQERKLEELKRTLGISQGEENQSGAAMSSEVLRKLETLRLEAQADYEKANSLYAHLATLSRPELKKAVATASPDGQLSTLQDQLATAEQKREVLLEQFSADHPEVKSVKRLIELINRQIDDRVEGILAGLKTKVTSLKASAEKLQVEVEAARKRDIETSISRQPYFQAKRVLEQMQQTREQVLNRLTQERIDAAIPK